MDSGRPSPNKMAKKLRKAREMRDNVTSLLVYFPSNAGDGWGF
jgi:hypothetical protein